MSCCAGASEPFKNVSEGETTYYYPLDFVITAVLDNDNSITMKDCGCAIISSSTANALAEFEPVLCWKNKNTGSLYTPEAFEKTLQSHGLIGLEVELQEYNDEDYDPDNEIVPMEEILAEEELSENTSEDS